MAYLSLIHIYLGKYTLYIFLYHTLILDTLLPKLTFLDNGPAFLKILVYMAGMLLLPLAGKNLYDWLKSCLLYTSQGLSGTEKKTADWLTFLRSGKTSRLRNLPALLTVCFARKGEPA